MLNSADFAPVSVIIPCFRCHKTIQRALVSILRQTFLPAEILLIDDASGDETLDLLYYFEKLYSPRVKVIALSLNSGPGLARNAGWEAATQPWLAFLDADDSWHPLKIETQLAWLESHPDVALCGHASQFSTGSIDLPVVKVPSATLLTPMQMLISNRLPTRSVMIRKNLPFRFGNSNFTEDYLLWLEIVLGGYAAYRLDSPLAFCFRPDFSPGGLSGHLWAHEKRELSSLNFLREKGALSWFLFILATCWSFAKFIRRFWLIRIMR